MRCKDKDCRLQKQQGKIHECCGVWKKDRQKILDRKNNEEHIKGN